MLEIIYSDQFYVAINKPSGLMVHKSDIARDVNEFALQKLRDQIKQKVYPCHRLDRPTSGVLLFALSSEAASRMGSLFESQQIEKSYLTLARGWPAKDEGEINYPLSEDKGSDKEKKAALSKYFVQKRYELVASVGKFSTSRYSLIEVRPRTGRKHQIRRHLKHLNHPIIGDTKYGKSAHNNFFKESYGFSRLALHCCSLKFRHPYSGEELDIQAPLWEDFKLLLSKIS